MDILNDLIGSIPVEPWWRFAVAMLIGLLIGLEREFMQQQADDPDFAGLRTFTFIALLGAISAYLYEDFGILPVTIAFGGLILLVVASHVMSAVRESDEGATTEIAALITFLLGAMVMQRAAAPVAIALSVVVAFLLAIKPRVASTVRAMSWEDLRTILQFGVVAAVILPLLPNRQFGPFEALNPFKIWLLVVFISGIGFAGYVLMKLLGAEKGVGLAALLGGMVSSTATTVGFSGRSKETPELSEVFARGILLASSVMFPRILLEVFATNPSLLRLLIVPIGSMLAAGALMVTWMWRRDQDTGREEVEAVKVGNPLKLSTALMFALAFTIVVIAVEVAERLFGNVGVYVTSLITGLTDVDAITLSLSQVARSGGVEPEVAAGGIVIAAITNTIVKAVIAWSVGSPELRRIIVIGFGAIALVGLVTGALTLFIF